jgi:GABA permease
MRRYLVVAHRTLGGDHLLEHVQALREEGPCRFLLLVPVEHPSDHAWSDGEVAHAARRRLQEGRDRFHDEGIVVDGEIGDANPVYAVSTVLRREGPGAFTGIILSTLPPGPSRWLHWDVPSRMRREHPDVPVTHLVADRVPSA